MNNCGLTWTGFDYARLAKLAMCVVVALNAPVAVAKNMYNDWAQKNAVNLNGPRVSEAAQIDLVPRNDSEAIAFAAANNIRSRQNIDAALRNNAAMLPRPNVGLISSDEISDYPYVDRYLGEQLGDKDITHYYILREDYRFQDLSGESITIQAGSFGMVLRCLQVLVGK